METRSQNESTGLRLSVALSRTAIAPTQAVFTTGRTRAGVVLGIAVAGTTIGPVFAACPFAVAGNYFDTAGARVAVAVTADVAVAVTIAIHPTLAPGQVAVTIAHVTVAAYAAVVATGNRHVENAAQGGTEQE